MGIQPATIIERETNRGLNPSNGFHINGEDGLPNFVSEALYWETYYTYPDRSFEWNNGQLEERPMPSYAKYLMYLWFLDLLRDYLHVHPIAKIVGLDMGFRMALPTKTTIRKPDLGLVLASNPVPLGDEERSYHGIFDMCIESLSDSSQTDIDRDTIIKRSEYASAGVQEYYILDDQGTETQFYQLRRRGVYQPLPRTQGIIRSQVLPGFQFRLQDLYSKPAPLPLVDDPLYSGFISPDLRAERQRTEQERTRAETQLAEERQRAEHYAALLRAAGLLS